MLTQIDNPKNAHTAHLFCYSGSGRSLGSICVSYKFGFVGGTAF